MADQIAEERGGLPVRTVGESASYSRLLSSSAVFQKKNKKDFAFQKGSSRTSSEQNSNAHG